MPRVSSVNSNRVPFKSWLISTVILTVVVIVVVTVVVIVVVVVVVVLKNKKININRFKLRRASLYLSNLVV